MQRADDDGEELNPGQVVHVVQPRGSADGHPLLLHRVSVPLQRVQRVQRNEEADQVTAEEGDAAHDVHLVPAVLADRLLRLLLRREL